MYDRLFLAFDGGHEEFERIGEEDDEVQFADQA